MNHELPSVAGQMEMTHEAFESACRVKLAELQENHLLCDNSLFYLLCEAVRCSRESDAKSRAIEELIEAADNFDKTFLPYSIHYGKQAAKELREQIANARKALEK